MISVIMPVYKAEKYLDRSITSVLNQSYSDFELLLIDDGSPDNSGALCDEWTKKDARIKVFHKPNGGTSDARNFGIEKAQGDYITFIDCDDYVMPHWLNDMYSAAQKTGADIVKSGIYYVPEVDADFAPVKLDYNLSPFKTVRFKNESIAAREFFTRLLTYEGYNAVWNQLVKADIHKKCLFPSGHLNEDYHIFFSLLNYSNKISIIENIGYCWGQRSESQSRYHNDSFIADMISDYLLHHNEFISRYNDTENAKAALVRATELFFFYLASAQRMESIKSDLTKATWKKLYPVTKNYDMNQLLPKVLFFQYKIYSISDSLYYQIMRIKKAVSKQ